MQTHYRHYLHNHIRKYYYSMPLELPFVTTPALLRNCRRGGCRRRKPFSRSITVTTGKSTPFGTRRASLNNISNGVPNYVYCWILAQTTVDLFQSHQKRQPKDTIMVHDSQKHSQIKKNCLTFPEVQKKPNTKEAALSTRTDKGPDTSNRRNRSFFHRYYVTLLFIDKLISHLLLLLWPRL